MALTGDWPQHRICRLCLATTTTYFSLTDESEASRMLEAVTSLKISPTDEISTITCLKCLLNLKLTFKIRQQMLGAEHRFRERILARMKKEPLREEHEPLLVLIKEEILEKEERETEELILEDKPETNSDICGGAFASQSTVERYKQRFHSTEDTVSEVKKVSIFKDNIKTRVSSFLARISVDLTCDKCGVKVPSLSFMQHHKTRFHTTRDCPKCSKPITTFVFELHLKSHLLERHRIDKQGPHTMHRCQFCAKRYKTVRSKRKHEDECTHKGALKTCDDGAVGRNRRKCPVCHKVIAKSDLKRHLERHKGIVTRCELCGFDVKNIDLRAHMKYKHTEPTHKCKYCDKMFKFKGLLVYHQKKEHLKQADHVCPTCGRGFYGAQYLKKHIQATHLKLKPHVCRFCKVSFATRHSMLTHERKHTKVTPYECVLCDARFSYSKKLKAHLMSEHDVEEELTHECEVCSKKFASEVSLAAHGRRVHWSPVK